MAASSRHPSEGWDPVALITENLDIWSSAIKTRSAAGRGSSKKRELYGIKKLRELILELAVRGLLVPQDPNDEPASELLKKIAKEKAKLLKEEKIKKQKQLPEIEGNDKPFVLPVGWEMVKFGTVAVIERGGSPRPINSYITNEPDGLNWIKIGDTDQGGKYITSTTEKIRKEGLSKTRMVYPGDFLLTNSMSFGRPYITKIEGCIHDGWLRISPPSTIDKDYLYLLLSSPYVMKAFKAAAAGAVVLNLNADKVRGLVILIPPLSEQHRIVAKVDELMALCDQIEQQTEASISAHQTLVQTLLGTLINNPTVHPEPVEGKPVEGRPDVGYASTVRRAHGSGQSEFKENWNRIAEHFDTLFTTEWSIDQLKQTILQLAVMGKLVPQDPNDEPASKLLKKIAVEKARLIKEGKIKKQKPLPPIGEDEKPFELPVGWEWVRLQDITSKITDGDHKTPPRITEGCRLLSAKNVREGFLDFENCDFISQDSYLKSRDRCIPEEGDLLIVSVGGTIGRSSVVPADSYFALVRSVALIKPIYINSMYLKYAMDSNLLQDSIHSRKRGGAQPCLYLSEISMFPFSLPTKEEQDRIVAKVNELMTLCDTLKNRINRAQTTQLQLADSVAEQGLH